LIEELNPSIAFDWTRILKGQGTPPSESRPPMDVRRNRPQGRGAFPSPQPPAPPAPSPETPRAEQTESTPDELGIVSDLEAPDGEAPLDVEPGAEKPPTPAHARLGAEGVNRLRARHAEILARLSEKVSDPARREELRSQADRLNPDTWVTADEVTQALEQYESVFASLREVVGRKRRRRRRGNRQGPSSGPGTSGDSPAQPQPDEPGDDEADSGC
jgi:hypothetical protein